MELGETEKRTGHSCLVRRDRKLGSTTYWSEICSFNGMLRIKEPHKGRGAKGEDRQEEFGGGKKHCTVEKQSCVTTTNLPREKKLGLETVIRQ